MASFSGLTGLSSLFNGKPKEAPLLQHGSTYQARSVTESPKIASRPPTALQKAQEKLAKKPQTFIGTQSDTNASDIDEEQYLHSIRQKSSQLQNQFASQNDNQQESKTAKMSLAMNVRHPASLRIDEKESELESSRVSSISKSSRRSKRSDGVKKQAPVTVSSAFGEVCLTIQTIDDEESEQDYIPEVSDNDDTSLVEQVETEQESTVDSVKSESEKNHSVKVNAEIPWQNQNISSQEEVLSRKLQAMPKHQLDASRTPTAALTPDRPEEMTDFRLKQINSIMDNQVEYPVSTVPRSFEQHHVGSNELLRQQLGLIEQFLEMQRELTNRQLEGCHKIRYTA